MFAQFLALLARHIDDHRLRGGELAADLFVSRSLLDRLVKASVGEPPASQLRATNASIIDAAAQADYSSHEAYDSRQLRHAVSPG